MSTQIKRDVAPVWETPVKRVRFVSDWTHAPENCWVIFVMDDADQADALGYHTLTYNARVFGKVFAKTALDYGLEPSITFSHEVLETWGDPDVDTWVEHPDGRWSTPLELCDAVEGDSYLINKVRVSNFLYPTWFNFKPGNVYDFLGRTPLPLMVAPGGYMVVEYAGGSTSDIMGAFANKAYIRAKGHVMSRSVRRQSV